jgi:hypothetical protein
LAVTGGDLRTPAQPEADVREQERERIANDHTEFQRALNAPWSYAVFANFGCQLTYRGRPWRKLADGNVTIFRLRPGSGRSQRQIIGDAAFERLQDMWARDGNRCRWSVAFPIIESYDIENLPDASDVLGPASYRRLFAHPSTLLRPLTDEDRAKLADLALIPSHATNAWIAIEDEAAWAGSDEKVIPNGFDETSKPISMHRPWKG